MRDLFAGKITRKAPIQINVIVDHLLKTLSIEARQHRISLMADLAPDLPKICADASQIEQAITNLIRNGIDAVTDAHPRERSLIIATRHLPSDFVEISVTDTGDGISPNVFPRIFETYFTTKRDRMGLGLAVARSIADLHQGAITAENNRKRGATFRIHLPVGAADGPAKPAVRVVRAAS